MGRTEDEPRFVSKHFEYKNRPYRDAYASVSLAVASLLFVFGGLYAVFNRDLNFFHKVSDDYLALPGHCPAESQGRLLLDVDPSDDTLPFKLPFFLKWLGPWIAFSVVFSAIMGVVLVHLFRTNAQRMIYFAVGAMLGTWAAYAVLFGASGATIPMIVALVMLGIYALAFYIWSDKFPLMAQLLSVTSTGLQQNSNVALIPLVLPVVLGVVSIPIFVFSGAAAMNGRVVQSSDVQLLPSGTCLNSDGEDVNCCTWQPHAWVPPYLFLSTLFWSWLVFLSDQIKTFAISGTIAQWYFSPVGATTSGNLSRSLGHALGPSFGSLCLSSAILALVNYLRQLAENARRRQSNFAMMLLSCIADCIYGMLQFITKFATIRMAIMGDSFFSAAAGMSGLLARNLLNTVAVWWLPPLFLNMYVFTISIGWGVLVGLINFGASGSVAVNGVLMGLVAFFTCLIILSFVVGLMLHIIDTVYICYALELEAQTCTKPEVHEVYNSLPKPAPAVQGDVIQNPDGHLAYGAPVPAQDEHTPLLGLTAPPAQQRIQEQSHV